LLTHPPTQHLPLPVIPVIDLKGGSVVRGIGGKREQYAPIETPLAEAARPLEMAQALAERVNHRQLYLADLDAIGGAAPAWYIHRKLLAGGVELWLDVGLADMERARVVSTITECGRPVHRIVAALETLPDLGLLDELVQEVGGERLVFSLDLRQGRVVTVSRLLRDPSPLSVAEESLARGVRRLIVLDVAAVGTLQGPPIDLLCGQIRRAAPQVELVAGGGVRGIDDLTRLRDVGCDAALVSTWLHGILFADDANLLR
jgi:phosphoribosylformimino-5-aminoimidazole carboxamide ribotide isomerase